MNTKQQLPTALLISGNDEEILVAEAQKKIAQVLCSRQGASGTCSCHVCDKVRMQKHHLVRWFSPEKQYLVEDINHVRNAVALLLPQGDNYFFVFEHAERMSQTSGNRLLKTIEEPPPGYRFLFLTTNLNEVLPTITSRCMQETAINKQQYIEQNALISHFLSEIAHSTLAEFGETLKSLELNHIESRKLLDQLILKFTIEYDKAIINSKTTPNSLERISSILNLLNRTQKHPPVAGSHNLFWKHLYMSFSVMRDEHKNIR